MLPPETLRQVHLINIKAKRAVTGAFAGQYLSMFKGRGLEFAEVREYDPGDDIRSIDWNVTARMGKPFIKRQIEERELTIMLLVDVSSSMHFGSAGKTKAEIATEIAALLTQSAVRAHDRVGMVLFTDRVEKVLPPLGGRNRTSRLVAEIMSIEPRGQGTDVAHALDYLDSVSSRRSISFILSDMHGGPFHRQVRRMVDRHEIVPVWLQDPAEVHLPNAGMVRLRDMETGQQVLIDTSHRPARDAFAARQAKRRADLRSQMTRLGLDLVEVETDKPYIHPILKFFQRRDQRRRVLT